MGRERHGTTWTIIFLFFSTAGCRGPAGGQGPAFDLTPYVSVRVPHERVFQQSNPSQPDEPAVPYEVRYTAGGRAEAGLMGRLSQPLERYFDPHSDRPHRPRVAWPTGERSAKEAFLVEFDSPVLEWPLEIRSGETVESSARMTAYDRLGVPFTRGSVHRWVKLGTFEPIVVNGQSYADAVRLEANSDLWFGWWAFVSLRETAWFARDVGLVRRTERMKGSALLLFRFNSTHEYTLSTIGDSQAGEAGSLDTILAVPGRWIRLAICLNRGVPHPRVGGLAVEWAADDADSNE